jgi:hypothetical protein
MWRKGKPYTLLVSRDSTVENSIDIPQKLKIELAYDPAIASPGI